MTRVGEEIRWAAVAVILGSIVVIAPLLGGEPLSAGLRVGSDSPAAQVIANELGSVPVTEGAGHDGQYNYLIARDPFGLHDHVELADDPAYRLRRPLLGWLAGAFGLAPPSWIVVGLAVWPIIGFALAAAAAARLRSRFECGVWALLGVIANPGLLLSLQLRTSDTLVVAGGLWALEMAAHRQPVPAGTWGAVATLAKEVAIVFGLAIAWWHLSNRRLREAFVALAIPTATLLAWMTVVALTTGDPATVKGNLDWPFAGIASSPGWNGVEAWLGAAAIVSLLVGVLGVVRTRSALIRAAIVPWLLLALVSSSVVWGDGNNAVRVFSPVLALGVLALSERQISPAAGPA